MNDIFLLSDYFEFTNAFNLAEAKRANIDSKLSMQSGYLK